MMYDVCDVFTELVLISLIHLTESVQTAAEDPAAGPNGSEPEAEDGQRAVRAVRQGETCDVFTCWTITCRPTS